MGSLTFQWEPVSEAFKAPNLRDLLLEHYEELAVTKEDCPLDPDFGRFVELAALGLFRTWTARDGGTLVGYIGWFIQPHLHYRSTLHAVEDLFLLTASHRRGLQGYRMFTESLAALKALGVKRVMTHRKLHFERERMTAARRAEIERIVKRAVKGDAMAIDDLVELFFRGHRTGLGKFFERMGFLPTDEILVKIL